MKQKLKLLINAIFFLWVALSFFTSPNQAFAQIECPSGSRPGTCPVGQCEVGGTCVLANPAPKQLVNVSDFGVLIQRFIQIFLATAGAIAVVFLIVGGFQYIMAHGNEEATEKAKKTVTGAIIGIVIIVLAFAIVAIVNNLLVSPPT